MLEGADGGHRCCHLRHKQLRLAGHKACPAPAFAYPPGTRVVLTSTQARRGANKRSRSPAQEVSAGQDHGILFRCVTAAASGSSRRGGLRASSTYVGTSGKAEAALWTPQSSASIAPSASASGVPQVCVSIPSSMCWSGFSASGAAAAADSGPLVLPVRVATRLAPVSVPVPVSCGGDGVGLAPATAPASVPAPCARGGVRVFSHNPSSCGASQTPAFPPASSLARDVSDGFPFGAPCDLDPLSPLGLGLGECDMLLDGEDLSPSSPSLSLAHLLGDGQEDSGSHSLGLLGGEGAGARDALVCIENTGPLGCGMQGLDDSLLSVFQEALVGCSDWFLPSTSPVAAPLCAPEPAAAASPSPSPSPSSSSPSSSTSSPVSTSPAPASPLLLARCPCGCWGGDSPSAVLGALPGSLRCLAGRDLRTEIAAAALPDLMGLCWDLCLCVPMEGGSSVTVPLGDGQSLASMQELGLSVAVHRLPTPM